jgi:ankyrin repeat protein
MGADINAKNKDDMTPLHLATKNGMDETVSLLIQMKADIHAKNKDDMTPLHFAAKNGMDKTVSLLIKEGADIHAKNNDNMTALHFATLGNDKTGYYYKNWKWDRASTVRLLIQSGADVNAKTKYNKTPLQLLKKHSGENSWQEIEFLLKYSTYSKLNYSTEEILWNRWKG